MNIKKVKNKIVIEIPFLQHRNNPYDPEEEKELTHNLIGVVNDDEQGIYQLNDLSYKDDQQVGGLLVRTYLEKPDFIKLCKDLELDYIEYPICATCHKTIYGCHSIDDKIEPICDTCDKLLN